MGSGSSGCRSGRGSEVCPICGSEVQAVLYVGKDSIKMAMIKCDGFRGFVGCIRADLHDKVVDGVNCRGKVIVRCVCDYYGVRKRKRVCGLG